MASAPPSFPGKALSNVPIGVPLNFMGRDEALAAIETALQRNEGRVAITVLHGMRGVGKTTLAAAYAEHHRSDYRATWWIRAQTEPTLRADLAGLGIRLGWVDADEKEEPAVEAVMERLRHEGERLLLIFDNAVDANALKAYLPRGGQAKVLVTSNARAWRGIATPVEIPTWPSDIGADYLIARTGRKGERAAAEALSQALGGLPLAHEQAAAYCERLEVSFLDYRSKFEAAPARLLENADDAPVEYHNGLTVAKTFTLAIDKAAKLHGAAEPLIVHAGLLAPEPIPLFVFKEAREHFGDPLASALVDEGLDKAIASLRVFALVERDQIVDDRDPAITTDAIRLHRLVRQIAASRLDSAQQYAARRALVAMLAAVYPNDGRSNPASWPRCATLTPHLVAICTSETADAVDSGQRADLLGRAGSYLHGRAAYSAARPLLERALAIREKALGPEHPDTATSLNNFARLLKEQGDLAAARPLVERALAIREKALGPEHPDTATSLNDLALLLKEQGNLAAARPLNERALAIYEKALGPEHPYTATSLNNFALLLRGQGDLAAARPLFERALAIRKKELGPEHPYTATSLNNFALLLRDQGDLAAVRPLFERALAIHEKALGPEHPRTAASLNNLASLMRHQGDLVAARPLFERALAIREKALGPEHPDTNRSRCDLARLLMTSGHAKEALGPAETALRANEKVLGPNHRWTKDTARVTAEALDALGRADQAAALRARYGVERDRQNQ
jgi:tetratricopeptide (TPR) repeat protein